MYFTLDKVDKCAKCVCLFVCLFVFLFCQLALDIWKRKMIEPLKETLVEHVLIEVKK